MWRKVNHHFPSYGSHQAAKSCSGSWTGTTAACMKQLQGTGVAMGSWGGKRKLARIFASLPTPSWSVRSIAERQQAKRNRSTSTAFIQSRANTPSLSWRSRCRRGCSCSLFARAAKNRAQLTGLGYRARKKVNLRSADDISILQVKSGILPPYGRGLDHLAIHSVHLSGRYSGALSVHALSLSPYISIRSYPAASIYLSDLLAAMNSHHHLVPALPTDIDGIPASINRRHFSLHLECRIPQTSKVKTARLPFRLGLVIGDNTSGHRGGQGGTGYAG